MATVNLGRIKPVFKGAYNNSTAYVVDDIVTSGGSSYICIQASSGNAVSSATYWTQMAAGGTDVGTTLTTQGDILYRDGSGLQRLAKGTAGKALLMNSSANAPEWGTVSSDFIKISGGGTPNDVGQFILDNIDVATYSAFRIIINAVPTNDDAYFRGQIRTGGASGADYSNSDYDSAQLHVTGSSSTAQRHESGVNYWEFIANSGNLTYEGITADITFYPRKSTMEPGHGNSFICTGTRTDSGNNFRSVTSSGKLRMTNSTDNTVYMTGIKFYFNTGDIKQYDYELWGMK